MSLRLKLIISCLIFCYGMQAQKVSHVYKINELVKRIDTTKTTMVINFWATWCKPCIEELPAFDSLNASKGDHKVLLVSLDFKEDLETKVNPFLKKHNIQSECVLLDEVNGNDFINKISKEWTGAIPGTLFKNQKTRFFIEKKMHLSQILERWIELGLMNK